MALRFSRFVRHSALLLGFTALTSPAFAAEVNEEGAAELKAMFSRMLDFQKSAAAINRNMLRFEGDVQVEPADTYYAVTMPHITIQEPGGAGLFDVGIIALNATPTDDENLWKVSLALPTPMTAYDAEGKPVFSVDIGRQRMAGLWHETFENFVTLDASYENISMSSAPANFRMTMPLTNIVYDLKQGENGLWSGPFTLDVNGIAVSAGGQEAFSIGRLSARSDISNLNAQALADYKNKIAALAENVDPSVAGQPPSSEHAMALYNTMFDFFTTAWSGFTSDIGVEDVNVVVRQPGLDEPQRLHLGNLSYGFDMTGFDQENIALAFRFGLDDFTVDPAPAGSEGLMPHDVRFDLRVNRLPFREMAELGKTTLESSLESPEMAQMAGMQAMMTLPALLTDAGTHIRVEELLVESGEYHAEAEAKINADMKAQFGATAEAQGKITGLESLIAMLNDRMNDTATPPAGREKIQNALQAIAFLQMLGREEQGGDGKATRSYDFKLGPDGRMTLNGGDLGALMGKPAPGMQQQPEPETPSAQ